MASKGKQGTMTREDRLLSEGFGPLDAGATLRRAWPLLVARLRRTFPGVPEPWIEDAVGDALAEGWIRWRRSGLPASMAWIQRKATWRLGTMLRRAARMRETPLDRTDGDGFEHRVERLEAWRRALAAPLPPETATVVALWMLDWTGPEIAAHLQVAPVTVRKRLQRGLDRLRRAALHPAAPGCHTPAGSCVLIVKLQEPQNERTDQGRQEGRKAGRQEGRKEGRKHVPCPGGGDRAWTRVSGRGLIASPLRDHGVVGFSVGGRARYWTVLLAAISGMGVWLGWRAAEAIPLSGTWTIPLRGNIQVFLCTASFQQYLPFLDQGLVRANIQNALALWNTYPGVDYRLVWSGDSPDNDGCTPGGPPPSHAGIVTIRANDYDPWGQQAFARASLLSGAIERGYVEFYRRAQPNGGDRPWGFDHTQNVIDFDTVLMHEVGHVLGFPHHTPPPNSVMRNGLHYTMHRVLWEEDIFKLRDTNQTYHYNLRTNRQVRRKYSTNNGLSWVTGSSLQEYTNANVAVAYDPWSGKNLVAWARAEPAHRIHTILCDGLTCDPATRLVHSGTATHYGVAAAGGAGKFLMAWTLTNDTRQIAAKYFSGGSWTTVWYLDYNGTLDYGSMWEPAVAYNSAKQAFLVTWTNWQIADSDDAQGRVRVCVIPRYLGSQRCVELSVVSNTTPGLACHSSNNQCILMWVNHVGSYNNHLSYRQGRINDLGDFELYGTGYYYWGGDIATDLPPSLTHGNGYWVAAWRGKADTLPGRAMRMADGNWPYWTDLTVIDTSVQASPSVAFVGDRFGY